MSSHGSTSAHQIANFSIPNIQKPFKKRMRRALKRASFLAIMFTSIFGLLVNQTQAYNEYYIRMYLPNPSPLAPGVVQSLMHFLRDTISKTALAFEGDDPPPSQIEAPKGGARRWQAAMPAGLYGQVNLLNG